MLCLAALVLRFEIGRDFFKRQVFICQTLTSRPATKRYARGLIRFLRNPPTRISNVRLIGGGLNSSRVGFPVQKSLFVPDSQDKYGQGAQ